MSGNLFLKYLLRFVIVMLIQVLLFGNIRFMGYVDPMFYIWFILSLPSNMNRSLFLVIAFVTGWLLDIFFNTPGMFAFATVLVAYLRAPLLTFVVSRDNTLSAYEPSIKTLGLSTYLKYASLLIVLLHLTLFSLEAFTFSHYELVLFKTAINAPLTLLLVLSVQKSKAS
jgi:rod shape-determining protein MreD